MKKYNRFLLVSIVLYLIIAFGAGRWVLRDTYKQIHAYRVEVNHLLSGLTTVEQLYDLDQYTYLKEASFLPKEITDEDTIKLFFQEENTYEISIHPWYQNGELLGYIKIAYQNAINTKTQFWILEFSLLSLELMILWILFYLKKNLIRPFTVVNELPFELAQGHLKGEVKVQKSKYFKNFLWGMSQLKDALDVSKKRQLALLEEKQKLLLSLSHDIKTPLNLIKLYGRSLEENIYETEENKKYALHQMEEKIIEIEQYVDEITHSSTEELLDLPVHIEEFYLDDLLQKVCTVYQEQCTLRQIELIIQHHKNCLLKGDFNRSQEVLENLFENAIKYGNGGTIELSFSEEEYCQLIHFYSTGNPVCDNEFNHLFDSFFRGMNARGKQGSGLGLYICKELMRKMEGTIYAEIKEDGMTFVVVFRK